MCLPSFRRRKQAAASSTYYPNILGASQGVSIGRPSAPDDEPQRFEAPSYHAHPQQSPAYELDGGDSGAPGADGWRFTAAAAAPRGVSTPLRPYCCTRQCLLTFAGCGATNSIHRHQIVLGSSVLCNFPVVGYAPRSKWNRTIGPPSTQKPIFRGWSAVLRPSWKISQVPPSLWSSRLS
jgi:hypothetical protein